MILTQLVHLLLLPPGLHCLLGLLACWLFWRGSPRLASGLACFAVVSLYLLASPIGAQWVGAPLEAGLTPVSQPATLKVRGLQAIVVLGGGRTPQAPEAGGQDLPSPAVLARLRYAATLRRASGLPILVTGGKPAGTTVPEAAIMSRSLKEDFGVSARWLESWARNTTENARFSAELLQPKGISRIVLVSHASHLPRAIPAFEYAGFTVLPAPMEFLTPARAYPPLMRWTPQNEALVASRRALHEWFGRVLQ